MENQQIIANAVSQILLALGENKEREGLLDTPKRVAKSLLELTSGHGVNPTDVVQGAIFSTESSGMVLQKDLEFHSLCEHHLLPFSGKVHVAYLPDKNIIGLSKISRVIDVFARRLQVQENLTLQIAKAIDDLLKPRGVAVMVEASHFCMMMRGVKKQGSLTLTSEFIGAFAQDNILRSDFLRTIKN